MSRHITVFRLSAALAVAFLIAATFGCSARRAPDAVLQSPEAAWQVFRRNYCTSATEPGLLVKASLYYSRLKPIKRTNRTLVTMWGDFGGPMRLDIRAGMGKLLAHIREDADELLVFYPMERTAYAHIDPVLGATRLGMPFPFSLVELGRVSMGDFSGLTAKEYVEGNRTDSGFVYTVHGALASTVTLDESGRPILLEGTTAKAYDSARTWRLEINRYEENGEASRAPAPLPKRLTLAMDNGEKGVLRIKSRELKVSSWPGKAMGLELPEGVTFRRLDNGLASDQEQDIPVVYEDKS